MHPCPATGPGHRLPRHFRACTALAQLVTRTSYRWAPAQPWGVDAPCGMQHPDKQTVVHQASHHIPALQLPHTNTSYPAASPTCCTCALAASAPQRGVCMCLLHLLHLDTAGTLDPEQLADADSKFMRVNCIQLHYKDLTYYPGASSSRRSSNGSPPDVSSNGHASATGLSSGDAAAGSAQPQPQEPLTLLFLHGFNGWVFNWRMAMPGVGNMVAELGRWVVRAPGGSQSPAHSRCPYRLVSCQQHLPQGCATTNSSCYVPPCCRPCRVIAFDRPPFGLSERPLQWAADQDNPYEQATGAKLAQVRGWQPLGTL